MTSSPISEIYIAPQGHTLLKVKRLLVYFSKITNQSDSMCHDPLMANHSLALSKER